eukprot:gene1763-3410_t
MNFRKADSSSFTYVNDIHTVSRLGSMEGGQSNVYDSQTKLSNSASISETYPSRLQSQSDRNANSNGNSNGNGSHFINMERRASFVSSEATSTEYVDDTDNRLVGNAIANLFDSAFSYTKLELSKLYDPNTNAVLQKTAAFGFKSKILGGGTDQGNQNALIQALKSALKTILEEVDILRSNCISIEHKYKETTILASQELQKSMNILYKLQMKTASLDESERIQKKLTRDILSLRDRLAKKEKERRIIETEVVEKEKEIRLQNSELVSLRSQLGRGNTGSDGDSSLQNSGNSVEAKIEAQLRTDLSTAHERIHELENILTHKKEDTGKLQTEITSLRLALASSAEDRMRQVREIEDKLRKDLMASQDRVRTLEEDKLVINEELIVKREEAEIANAELNELRLAVTRLQERLARVLDAKQVTSSSNSGNGSGTINSNEFLLERDQRIQAQQREEKERIARIEAQKRLAEAETKWEKISLEVEKETDAAQFRFIEVTQQRDKALEEILAKDEIIKTLEAELEVLRRNGEEEKTRILAEFSAAIEDQYKLKLTDYEKKRAKEKAITAEKFSSIESRLIEAHATSRRLNNTIQELKGNIRVFARIRPLQISSTTPAPGMESLETCLETESDGTSLRILRLRDDSVSFVEIYNESVKDLLRAGEDDESKHDIKRDVDGNTVVTDVTLIQVDPNDSNQLNAIMTQAARMRNVGATSMNSQSSRSHAIFCLHLSGTNRIDGQTLVGSLSLVDLAGSERLKKSNATGDTLKETQAINKSLSCLANVFTAIGNKQAHIPFRDSKLTYLLQPALSGNGKTLMMVNLSPEESSYTESLCSLRFANQVNQCVLGPAQRNLRSNVGEKIPNTSRKLSALTGGKSTQQGKSLGAPINRTLSSFK